MKNDLKKRYLKLASILCLAFCCVVTIPAWALQERQSSASNEIVLVLSDGSRVPGELISIKESMAIVLVDGKTQQVEATALQKVVYASQSYATIDEAIRVTLVDGSTILASQFTVDDGIATLVEPDETQTKQSIETRNIHSVLLLPVAEEQTGQWNEITESTDRSTDLLVFQREQALDYVEGTIANVTTDSIGFATPQQTAEADRTRINGLVYFHAAGRQFVPPAAKVTTKTGSVIWLRNFERDGDDLFGQTISGTRLMLKTSSLVEVDFSATRYQWLGDMIPSTIQWTPIVMDSKLYEYQKALNQPRFNQDFRGEALRLRFSDQASESTSIDSSNESADPTEYEFTNGLAVKGGTRIVFALARQYQTIEGYVGFDPVASENGIVQVTLLGDGTPIFQEVMENGSRSASLMKVDVSGVERLTILVDYHDGRHVGDVIHFCNLRAVR